MLAEEKMKKHYCVLVLLFIFSVLFISCSKKADSLAGETSTKSGLDFGAESEEASDALWESRVAGVFDASDSSEALGKKTATELNVYAYDSFCGDWGAGNAIVRDFEKKYGVKVNLIGCGAALQMYSRYVLEGDKSVADVLVGLADNMEIDENLFYEWQPKCKADLTPYDSKCLIPFNYGFYSFLVNKDYPLKNLPLPTCLADLVKPQYSKSFVLIDPRTSSAGLGLLKWTILALGEENAYSWWKTACENALTVSNSWSSAYGIFTQGEAPFVLSYTTSPVYHRMYEDNYNIVPLEFSDGYVETVEYLAISENAKDKELAKLFCEYVLTEGQKDIAVTNTMFPANRKTELPKEYEGVLNPTHVLQDTGFVEKQDSYLDKWTQTVVR